MDDLTHDDLQYWGEEYRRLRQALPRGTSFHVFLTARHHYRRYAHQQLRDWRDNPRVMPIAQYKPIIIN